MCFLFLSQRDLSGFHCKWNTTKKCTILSMYVVFVMKKPASCMSVFFFFFLHKCHFNNTPHISLCNPF